MIEVINTFHKFSFASGLKPNETKCEIAAISVLKGVSLALCGMDCIDLTKKTMKVLGTHWSENQCSSPSVPSAIASQVIWYSECIKIDNKTL